MFSQLKPFRKVKRKINGKIKKTAALLLILPMIWAMLPVEAHAFATKGPDVRPNVQVTYGLNQRGDEFGNKTVPYGTLYGSEAAPLNAGTPTPAQLQGYKPSGYQLFSFSQGAPMGVFPEGTPFVEPKSFLHFQLGYPSCRSFITQKVGDFSCNLTFYDLELYDVTNTIKIEHCQFYLIDSLVYGGTGGYGIEGSKVNELLQDSFRYVVKPWVGAKLYDTKLWEAADDGFKGMNDATQKFHDGSFIKRSENGVGSDIGGAYTVDSVKERNQLLGQGFSYGVGVDKPPYVANDVMKIIYPQVNAASIQEQTWFNETINTQRFVNVADTPTDINGQYDTYNQYADFKINLKALHLRGKIAAEGEKSFISQMYFQDQDKTPLDIRGEGTSFKMEMKDRIKPYEYSMSVPYSKTRYFAAEKGYVQYLQIPLHDFKFGVAFEEGLNRDNLILDWRIGSYSENTVNGKTTQTFNADLKGTAVEYTIEKGSDGKERAYFKMPVSTLYDYYRAKNPEEVYRRTTFFLVSVREGTAPQPVVTGVTIEPALANVTTGSTLQLSATVQGTNLSEADKQVNWSIDEVTAGLTTESSITVNGLLSVGAAEKQTALTVKATSKKEPSKYAAAKIRINSSEPIPQEYPITVMNGTADKAKAAEGTIVTLTAADLAGKTFTHWTAVPAVTLADAQRPTTTFMMPNEAVSLTANYKDNSSGGGGSGGGGGGSGGGGSSGGSSGGGGSSNPASTTPAPPVNPVPAADTKQPSLPAMTFNDVAPTNWYHDAVTYVLSNNLMKGTSETTFQPMENATRGMIATILYNMAGAPAQAEQSSFNDIAAGKWYTPSVTWAEKQGLVGGFPDNTFRPADKINREQLIFILYQYALKNGKVNTTSRGNPDLFTDGAKISPWAKQAMIWALDEGLLTGKGNNILDPKGDLTRAELAALLMKFHPMFK